MSASSSVSGFSAYDLLTRLIPGVLTLLTILISLNSIFDTFSFFEVVKLELSAVYVFLFIIISFITGETIDFCRRKLVPVPTVFRRLLCDESENERYLSYLDRKFGRHNWRYSVGKSDIKAMECINNEVISRFQSDFCTIEDKNDINIKFVYDTLSLYMDSRMSSESRRRKANYIFFRNITYSVIPGISILLSQSLFADVLTIIIVSMGLLALLLMITSIIDIYARIEISYIDSILIEYLQFEQA